MPYDDIRFSGWDDPDENDNGAGEDNHDANFDFFDFGAIGTCKGCDIVTNVNGWEFCEFCMDEFE